MFDSFAVLARELRGHFITLYWVLIVPMALIVFLLEFFKEDNPAPGKILKRVFISVLLLLSFDFCSGVINSLATGIADKIDGIRKLKELAHILSKSIQEIDLDWFSLRKSLIYLIGLLSYLVAYVGVFTAKAVIHFSWTLLYVCSPFMILAFISSKTAGVTKSLYRGLIDVSLWNIMASILGVLLLEFAKAAPYSDENFLVIIIVNLCIATSLLLIPYTVKSLTKGTLTDSASVMAAIPGLVVTGEFKKRSIGLLKSTVGKSAIQARRGSSWMAKKTGLISQRQLRGQKRGTKKLTNKRRKSDKNS